jgi:hypothetical protein
MILNSIRTNSACVTSCLIKFSQIDTSWVRDQTTWLCIKPLKSIAVSHAWKRTTRCIFSTCTRLSVNWETKWNCSKTNCVVYCRLNECCIKIKKTATSSSGSNWNCITLRALANTVYSNCIELVGRTSSQSCCSINIRALAQLEWKFTWIEQGKIAILVFLENLKCSNSRPIIADIVTPKKWNWCWIFITI